MRDFLLPTLLELSVISSMNLLDLPIWRKERTSAMAFVPRERQKHRYGFADSAVITTVIACREHEISLLKRSLHLWLYEKDIRKMNHIWKRHWILIFRWSLSFTWKQVFFYFQFHLRQWSETMVLITCLFNLQVLILSIELSSTAPAVVELLFFYRSETNGKLVLA